jgi:hypothetical protein
MAGVLIPLAPRAVYDLSLMNAAVTCPVALVRRIPLYCWRSGVLQVLLYDNSLLGTARVTVRLLRSTPSWDDPYDDFIGSQIAFVQVSSASAAKALYVNSLGDPWPPFVDLQVVCSNITAPVPGSATLSIELLLRGRYFDAINWIDDSRWSANSTEGSP